MFTVVYWFAKPLICSEAGGDLVVIEPVPSKHNNKAIYIWKAAMYVS